MVAGAVASRRVRGGADFFVAGRALPGWLVFVTLLAANIGAGSTVGATGLGYRHGLSAWWWSGSAALGSIVLALVVAPRLHERAARHGFLTVGDFLEHRYDRSVRLLVSTVLGLGTLSILAGQLIAMAWALQVIAGVPKAWGCLMSGAIVVAYVGAGGLLASVWVNLLQLVVLLVGFVVATPFALQAAGGWERLAAAGPEGYATLTGMGGPAIAGLLLVLGPSFIVSPGLVQKTFGARSAAAARGAVLGNVVALAAFAFVPALLGMATRVLRPGLANPEMALPTLLVEVLPPWLGALGLAALFAAEISTADAVLFMLSTSLSRDLWGSWRGVSDEEELLRAGRWATAVSGLAGAFVAMALPSVVEALRGFYAILTACLFVPLLAGLFFTRPGAAWARAGVIGAVAVTFGLQALMAGRAAAAWLAPLAGIGTAVLTFAVGAVVERRQDARDRGAGCR